MYLLNIYTLKLEEVKDETDKRYAILSHVWQEEHELLFADVDSLAHSRLSGAEKIRSFCQLVRTLNNASSPDSQIHHVWVDTCCIDKKSSAELSEAINAMYSYYSSADFCVAYLSDVEVSFSDIPFEKQFAQSIWFTRCWTLQELLAPTYVQFYNKDWSALGSKHDFADAISNITRIDVDALRWGDISKFSVAQRMSWSAGRKASRREDQAYSLMGLFDVNMPMLYGEGTKAFRRLQEAILADTDDETLFAWSWDHLPDSSMHVKRCGLLAPSPDYFWECGTIYPAILNERDTTFHSTNRGISGEITMVKVHDEPGLIHAEELSKPEVRLALLNAAKRTDQSEVFICIFLVREDARREWSRIEWNGYSLHDRSLLLSRTLEGEVHHIHVRHFERLEVAKPANIPGFDLSSLRLMFKSQQSWVNCVRLNNAQWQSEHDDSEGSCIARGTKTLCPGVLCVIDCSATFEGIPFMHLGFDTEFSPFCILSERGTVSDLNLEDPDAKIWKTLERRIQDRVFVFVGGSLASTTFTQLGYIPMRGVYGGVIEFQFSGVSKVTPHSIFKRRTSRLFGDLHVSLRPYKHELSTTYKVDLVFTSDG